jgi:4-amino-4-deoxy-L-arabinose transferase-like glycosyltransferase
MPSPIHSIEPPGLPPRLDRTPPPRPSERPAAPSNSRLDPGHAFVLTNGWAFALLVAACVLPGLLGHQPWKQDETYIIAIVRSMVDTHDFVVPHMASEPFMEKPPLYYWVAAGLARLLTPALPFHDAARLATGLFVLLACAALARCGRLWRGRVFGRAAVLVLLGCIGLQAYAHLMLTDIALLAGIALGFSGIPCWREQPARSGFIVGTGVGMGFLAKGLLAPGLFAAACLLLPLCFRRWRHAAYLRTAGIALLAALPWLLVWPTLLYLRSPALFSDWFWLNNLGRFLGFAVPVLGAAHDAGFWSKNLWWITLPAGPLAIVALWRARRTLRDNEMLQACAVFAAVTLGVLVLSASARGGYALPLLVPLAILGADGALGLPPAAERGWRRTALLGLGTLALLIWCAWGAVMFSDHTPGLGFLRGQLAPHPDHHLDAALIFVSILATLAAAVLAWHPVRQIALQTWTIGVILCWLLLANLFMPWADQVKSYRKTFAAMHAALPADVDCVASDGLGESQRAMLSYYHGIITKRLEFQPGSACRVVLVQGWSDRPPQAVDPRLWKMIWEGARPADTEEHFWLYERQAGTPGIAAAMPRAPRSSPETKLSNDKGA